MKRLILVSLIFYTLSSFGQQLSVAELTSIIQEKDQQIFEKAFNNCETVVLKNIIAEEAEFYHDMAGKTEGKANFITSIEKGICGGSMPYKPMRVLEEESHQVFPLYSQGTLYGAVQTGIHRFYAKEADKEPYFTSIANFTHLWELEEGAWKLTRVISYNHLTTEEKNP